MKKIFIAGVVFTLAPFAVFAQTATTTVDATTTTGSTATTTVAVDPGLVPGDFFYFLDGWRENLRLAFTFNKEGKAKLHLQYAKERAAEINKVLQNPNAKLDDVASAKKNLDAQVADAAAIVKSEKEAGNNVADLANELDTDVDEVKNELKGALRGHQDHFGQAEAEIRAKIAELTASSTATSTNSNALKGLTQALESITKEKMHAAEEENNIEDNASSTQAIFEDAMGKEMAAQKHLNEAMHFRDNMEQGTPALFGTSSARLMRDAEAAMKRGDFESAKNISKEAQQALEKANEMNGEVRKGMPPLLQGMPIRNSRDGMEKNLNDSEGPTDGRDGTSSNEVRVQNY